MRIRIGTKIFIVLLIFFTQISLLMFVLFMVNRQHEQTIHKQYSELEKMSIVKDLQLALTQMVMPANDYLISGGAPNEPENFKIIDLKTRDLIEKLNISSDTEEKQLLNHIEKQCSKIKEIVLQIFAIPNTIGNVEGGRLMEKMDKVADDALRDAEMFYKFVQQDMEKAEIEMRGVKVFFDLTILAGILSNVGLILFGLFFFRRTISLPLASMRKRMLEIGRGNLDTKINIRSNDEIGDLANSFNEMAKNLQESQGVIQRNYEMQTVLNKLLYISLQTISTKEMLGQFIGQITSISWLTLESKGAIFLIENNPQVLILKAQQGLAAPLQKICAQVPFGRCLCGRAALSGKIVFADHVDERHENRYEGILPHGHYCIPIMLANKKVLGVINLYTKEGRYRDEKVEEFLNAIANVIAGVIERKKIDESLKMAYLRLQETQDQLIQAEKLNAVGQLASGVAHEVKNPLGIIMQGINYLEGKASCKEKDIFEALTMVKASVKRADKIINLLLDFSKIAILELQPEDINSVLESCLLLIKTKFEFRNIEIVSEIQKGVPKVLIDINRIEQVFVNILLNAIQAMPNGGKIIIRVYDKILEETKNGIGRREEDYFQAGERVVRVEIEDTGVGISEENLKMVFNPFFTTKGPAGGTGLGLAVTRNIISMHKALIEVKSQVGVGTRVIVTLRTAGRQ